MPSYFRTRYSRISNQSHQSGRRERDCGPLHGLCQEASRGLVRPPVSSSRSSIRTHEVCARSHGARLTVTEVSATSLRTAEVVDSLTRESWRRLWRARSRVRAERRDASVPSGRDPAVVVGTTLALAAMPCLGFGGQARQPLRRPPEDFVPPSFTGVRADPPAAAPAAYSYPYHRASELPSRRVTLRAG